MTTIAVEIEHADALMTEVDVLALKYAQANYGLDAIVATLRKKAGLRAPKPLPWESDLVKSTPHIAARHLLFVGVPPLGNFEYQGIRRFAHLVLRRLAKDLPNTRWLGVTVHGSGYGLDEVEAILAEVRGFKDALRLGESPKSLSKISILEQDEGRANRLRHALSAALPDAELYTAPSAGASPIDKSDAGPLTNYDSSGKAHVFVAMPFMDQMDDLFHYGIASAVRAAGFVCERADSQTYTGDVLERVRSRIRAAAIVVADLTDANPNVYLEVGYAWGVGVPTVLLVRDADELKFDVQGQRCVVYKSIKDLEQRLGAELKGLATSGL